LLVWYNGRNTRINKGTLIKRKMELIKKEHSYPKGTHLKGHSCQKATLILKGTLMKTKKGNGTLMKRNTHVKK